MAILSGLRLLETALTGGSITTHVFFMSFYNVLGFYLLAVASAPLWFALMRQTGGSVWAFAALLPLYVGLDFAARWAFLRYEPQGFMQLLRLYATAKFSYFNMSVGALMGVALGHMLQRNPDLPLRRPFLVMGPILVLSGLLWGGLLGEASELLHASRRISYWKWCLYFGLVLSMCAVLWPHMSHYGRRVGWRSVPLKLLCSIGILALPLFVFQAIILGIKQLLDAAFVPDFIGMILVLSLFFGIGGITVRRIWRLYFL
jgi:hypothetical protein